MTNSSNSISLSRRAVLGGLTSLAVVPGSAWALSPQSAESLVRSCVADITKTINSGKSDSQLIKEFDRIFKKYADVPTIAAYSLGPAARSASQADMRAYTSAFSGYISRKYGRRFREFIGGEIEVRGAKKQKSYIVVETTAKLRGESPFAVDFLVSDRSGSDKFFNVIIEGVNMLTTERTEIGALLDKQRGDVGKLAAQLKTLS